MILHGDCLDRLKELPDNSVDSVVTDPPYGISFMGRKWDYDVPSIEIWREALRVLKPGGHLLSFGGTRTYHRMAVNIEDAGFEVRDQVAWVYGQGFPKSHSIEKAILKKIQKRNSKAGTTEIPYEYSKKFAGLGTALKPSIEPICLARKPLEKGLTVAQNVQKWGTGAINVDASRIETSESWSMTGQKVVEGLGGNFLKNKKAIPREGNPQGRWPANVIFDEEAAAMLDEQSGNRPGMSGGGKHRADAKSGMFGKIDGNASHIRNDSGGASRFFYVAKASKSERNRGLEGMPTKDVHRYGAGLGEGKHPESPSTEKNFHPTVKPIKLMEYLITMVTPPMGIVLDPFTGSGTTGVAATKLGFGFIGIEREAEYVEIAEKRIEAAS